MVRQDISDTQAALETRVLHGLAAEWDHAVAYLREEHRTGMRPPVFSILELACWGRWTPEKREIALSRRLVWDYPWTSVREVLLHEMAHQMTDELFGGDSAPHGERFHAACRLLNADPRASGRYPAIAERLGDDTEGEDSRILVRVRKLLAMAGSSNRNEAEVAMAKARAHIAKYNLRLLADDRERGYCSLCLGAPALRHARPAYALANLLGEFYFVRPIWTGAYVLAAQRIGRVLEISGTPANVKMAGYVHDFLRRSIAEQWDAYRAGVRFGARQRDDFAVGLIGGFRERLHAHDVRRERSPAGARAMVRTGDQGLAAYLRQRFPRLRTTGSRALLMDPEAHDAGMEAGRSTVLRAPIEAPVGNRGLLLAS